MFCISLERISDKTKLRNARIVFIITSVLKFLYINIIVIIKNIHVFGLCVGIFTIFKIIFKVFIEWWVGNDYWGTYIFLLSEWRFLLSD